MEDLDKVTILDWLKRHGRDREWLAEKCNAEMGTVNSWFSTRGFSDSALATIEVLMQLDAVKADGTNAPDETGLIELTTGEFERIEKARELTGFETRPEFYREAILKFVEEIEAGNMPASSRTSDSDDMDDMALLADRQSDPSAGADSAVQAALETAARAFLAEPPGQGAPAPKRVRYTAPARRGSGRSSRGLSD